MKKFALSAILTFLAVGAYAQTPAAPAAAPAAPGAATAPAKPIGMADKKFIKDFSEVVLIEQAFLKLLIDSKPTLSEGFERDVKKADADLKKLWTALATLASSKKADLATEISKSDLAKVQKLGKEKRDKFQKEFFKDFGKETGKGVKLLDGAKTLQDPEVKIFAEDWGGYLKFANRVAESGEKSAAAKK